MRMIIVATLNTRVNGSRRLLEELREIQQVVLLYPPQGEKGPCRTASVLTKQTLPQQLLATTLGLDRLGITPRG